METWQVTARSGLLIREFPEPGARVLTAMPHGLQVRRLDEHLWNERWLRIQALLDGGRLLFEGYSARKYLSPVDELVPAPEPLDAEDFEIPEPVDPLSRRRSLAELHPKVRDGVKTLLERLEKRRIFFKVFEAFRTPALQEKYYAIGRTAELHRKPVTRARAWSSYHNYGLAADLVINVPGVGMWEDKGKHAKWWEAMHEEARKVGLKPLSFELPHVQLADISLDDLRDGRLPAGGDGLWRDMLKAMAKAYPDGAPPLDALSPVERPPLDELARHANGAANGGPQTPISPRGASEITLDLARSVFDPDVPLSRFETHLPNIKAALSERELGDAAMLAFALAVVKTQTAAFQPVSEMVSRFNTAPDGPEFGLYDHDAALGNDAEGDGARYRGRGFLQLRGKKRYREMGEAIGVGDRLVQDPDMANEPGVAAQILAAALKEHETALRADWAARDYTSASKRLTGTALGAARFSDVVDTLRRGLGV